MPMPNKVLLWVCCGQKTMKSIQSLDFKYYIALLNGLTCSNIYENTSLIHAEDPEVVASPFP
jgi:hypothetical protein